MKKKLLALAIAVTGGACAPALAAPDVGVSIGIHQPGVYGRIDIGNYPAPAVVYPQPVIVAPPRVVVERPPVYLYVPPGHQKNWKRYCGRYGACGQPVYFVQERWVRERWEHEHDARRDGPPGHDRGDRGRHRGHDKHDDRDEGHGHGRGH